MRGTGPCPSPQGLPGGRIFFLFYFFFFYFFFFRGTPERVGVDDRMLIFSLEEESLTLICRGKNELLKKNWWGNFSLTGKNVGRRESSVGTFAF